MIDTLSLYALAGQLLLIAVIDLRTYIIPDVLNFTLALTGLWLNAMSGDASLSQMLIGALVYGGTFYGVRHMHKVASGRIGLGMGDVKMAFASGIWLAPASFPLFLLIASITALLLVILSFAATGHISATSRLPFGPFLAIALLVSWLAERSDVTLLDFV